MLVRQDLDRDHEIKYNHIREEAHNALEAVKHVLNLMENLVDVEALEDEHRPVHLNKAEDLVEDLRLIYQHAHYVLEPQDQYESLLSMEPPLIKQYPQNLRAIYQI